MRSPWLCIMSSASCNMCVCECVCVMCVFGGHRKGMTDKERGKGGSNPAAARHGAGATLSSCSCAQSSTH